MSWGRPELLYLLWALPLLLLGVALALRSRRRALAALGALVAGLAGPGAQTLHRRRLLGWVAVATLTVLALGQPRWGYRWQELKREGIALVVVLDVSSSMNATDVSPSRMERAQRKVLDLLDLLTGDRVGLVLFAAGPYPRVPLTLDYDAVRQIVRDSDTHSLGAQGSDLGAAIDEAGKLLASAEGADKAILVISDGEDHAGEGLNAARRAAEAGVHIYTLGVGTPDGAPVPVDGGGFKNDASGQVVLSRLDEDGLKAIAAAGAGAYVRASAGAADLRALYEDEIRGKLAAAEQGSRRDRVWDERYQWPLGVALVLGLLLSGMRARPATALLLAALLVAGAPARAGDPEVDRLTALQLQNPGDLSISEQLGEALFKAGDYARAEDVLRGVAERSDDAGQRARARYNEGLAAYRGGRLNRALEDWQQVLEDQPDHKPAAQNISSVQKELQMRLQQQQQQNQQNQQNQQSSSSQDPQSQDPSAQNQQDSQQDGQPQDPQQAQDDQQSQQNQQNQSDPPQQAQDGNQGQQPPPSDGTREERQPATAGSGDTGGADDGEQAQAERGQAEQGQGDTGQPQDAPAEAKPGKLSAEAAERLVDGLEEGEPRVVVDPKRRGGKDW